ncbi:hypothetical protein A6770_34170 [Nostoc minutum NIES-26]|uniref:Calx-beta domain-containing protein n=1 Tax=Nostoc minutum NIES-26 TaxID=1844469 RepID=A0A367Q232_9NOSO|nr:hypothetical protein A6770_34170 [Nostoc minutum NIES-26]
MQQRKHKTSKIQTNFEQELQMPNLNIIFIDRAVVGYESLIAGIQPGTSVVILDSTRDGVEQITQALQGGEYQSVQIISHGSEGSLQIGATQLNANNLNSYTNQLQQWRNYLTDNADILLYACNVAAFDRAFVQRLSQITGADVAASDDITGNAELGGDWDLEVKIGEIESDLALIPEVTKTYRSILPSLFAPATNVSVVGNLRSVAVGDFNNDGYSDFAVTNYDIGKVSVFLAKSTGGFGAATNFDVRNSPFFVTVGDLNNDGKSDLVVANYDSNNVSVLLGNGSGSFGSATQFNVGTNPTSVAIADFNNDGKSDLVVANYGSNNISVLLGNGIGGFGTATPFNVGSAPIYVTVADFNNDGKSDLVLVNPDSSNVSVLLGNGNGTFGAATNFSVGSAPNSAVVGDFNKDGKSDLAVVNTESKNVSILLGNGSGGFGTATNFEVGSSPISATLGDFNRDGNSDLAVANFESNNVSVLLGNGSGGFGTATNFNVGTNPTSVAMGDFDKDSNFDLAVANYESKDVSVLLNASNLDPVLPKVSFGKAAYYTAEGSTGNKISISVTLDSTPDTDVTIPIVINGSSTATNGSDYTISSTSLTFLAGATGSNLTQQITFTIKSDTNEFENNETVVLNFGTLTGVTEGANTKTTLNIADYVSGKPIFINEILFDPPSTDTSKEYIELRGTPDTTIAPGTYLVGIEGDYSTNPGAVQDIFDLSGKQFGSNGLLVLLQKGSTYTANPGANVITNTGTGAGWGSGTLSSLNHTGAADIENGSVSFFLIQTATAPTLSSDIDLNNDGTADGAVYSSWNLLDSVAVLDGGATDKAYSNIVFRKDSAGLVPMNATVVDTSFIAGYVGRSGNTTGSAASDWVASLPSGTAPNLILGTDTDTSLADLAGQPLNHIGNTNFAPVNVNYAISTNTPTVTEGNSGTQPVSFTVTRSGDTSVATSVNYVLDGTAIFNSDYNTLKIEGVTSGVSGSIVFAPGEITKNITLNVVGDKVTELDETINLNLSYPKQTVAIAPGTITINNDDNPPTISFVPISINGKEDSGNLVFAVKLSNASSQTITVDYTTSNDTAIAGDDYTPVTGTLTFNPGDLTQTITVPILDDLVAESSERFFINLKNPTNATIGDNPAIGTITDDDPTISIASISGSENSGNMVFSVKLSKASTQTIKVNYNTTDDTAIAGVDYTPITGTLTFNPGDLTQTITVPILDDLVAESSERFFVNLSNSNVIITNNQAIGTITDDDPTISIAAISGSENSGNMVFSVKLSKASSQTIKVNYNTTDDTASAGVDYTPVTGTLTFNPGDLTQTITVPILDDLAAESSERFFVNLSNSNVIITNNQAIGTITDDDPTISIAAISGSENSGNMVFSVKLSKASTQAIKVNYNTTDDTAIAGVDYTPVTGTLTFNPGDLTQTITVPILDDLAAESSERFFINLTNPNVTFTNNQAIGTITDDDPTISFVADRSGSENSGNMVFSVKLSKASTQTIKVNYNTTDDTASAGVDYTPVTGTLTFNPGDLTQTITVPILDDLVAESSERFFVNLTNPNVTFTDNQAIGTITDDDPTISFVADRSGSENSGNMVFSVKLSKASTQTIKVNYNTTDDTAIAGVDYTAVTGTLTFNPGDPLTQTITVPILDDIFVESGEQFFVNLSNPNVTFTDNQAIGSITDNDTTRIVVSPPTGLVTTEAGGTANFSIQLTNQPTADVTINLSSSKSSEGTISASSVTFTAANWNTPQIVKVTGVNDGIADDNIAYKIITSNAVSSDTKYSNFNVNDVEVVNIKSGNQINSIITGSANNDNPLSGTNSDDLIFGFAGNDTIVGGFGNDQLYGGVGSDNLTGGAGHDIFVLAKSEGKDTINDFNISEDLIALSGGLTYSGLSITQSMNDTLISITANSESLALLTGIQASTLNASHFVTY